MIKYELKNGNVLKDGHTMFLQDVVTDLNRGAFLERERTKQQSLPIDLVVVPFVCGDCKIELKKMDNGDLFCPDCLTKYKAN